MPPTHTQHPSSIDVITYDLDSALNNYSKGLFAYEQILNNAGNIGSGVGGLPAMTSSCHNIDPQQLMPVAHSSHSNPTVHHHPFNHPSLIQSTGFTNAMLQLHKAGQVASTLNSYANDFARLANESMFGSFEANNAPTSFFGGFLTEATEENVTTGTTAADVSADSQQPTTTEHASQSIAMHVLGTEPAAKAAQ